MDLGSAFRCCVAMWLAFANASAMPGAEDAPVTGVAAECSQLLADYHARLSGGARLEVDRAESIRLRQHLAGKLSDVLDRAKDMPTDVLTIEDLLGLVAIAETHGSYVDVIDFAEAAIVRDSGREAAYVPLVRALLNTKQHQRAEDVLRQCMATLPADSRVRSLHGHFYYYYYSVGRLEDAARHLERFCEYYWGRVDRDPDAPFILVAHLEKYRESQKIMGRADQTAEWAAARLQQVESLCTNDPTAGSRAYWRLRCELTQLAGLEDVPVVVSQYLRAIAIWNESSGNRAVIADELRWIASFHARASQPESSGVEGRATDQVDAVAGPRVSPAGTSTSPARR